MACVKGQISPPYKTCGFSALSSQALQPMMPMHADATKATWTYPFMPICQHTPTST